MNANRSVLDGISRAAIGCVMTVSNTSGCLLLNFGRPRLEIQRLVWDF